MGHPTNRLFHLHYHVPDPERTTRQLAGMGLPRHRRIGRVDGESVALSPDDEVPDDFHLRLQSVQRGYVNVTVATGNTVDFDHFGIVTGVVDPIVERAERAAEWRVQSAPHRTLLHTPWGFRVELQPEAGDVASALGAWELCHFEHVTLTVPASDAAAVEDGLDAVVGDVPGLHVSRGPADEVTVPEATVEGSAFPGGRTITVDELA